MAGEQSEVVHFILLEKFTPRFVDFVYDNFNTDNHAFYCFGDAEAFPIKRRPGIRFESDYLSRKLAYWAFGRALARADRVMLHSLFDRRLVELLARQQHHLHKCFWFIWGADLYWHVRETTNPVYEKRERYRRQVIQGLGHLVTYLDGDITRARDWYDAQGQGHDCLLYPSNVIDDFVHSFGERSQGANRTDRLPRVLLGNSADPSNMHMEAMDRLAACAPGKIELVAPLSYGPREHAEAVKRHGTRLFGSNFVAIENFMPHREYAELLAGVDCAVFNHDRQQGMGNINTLLSLGKPVALRRDTSSWKYLNRIGIRVFDAERLDLETMLNTDMQDNRDLICRLHSVDQYKAQLARLFGQEPQ